MKIENTFFWKVLDIVQKTIIIITILAAMLILVVETLGRPFGFNFKGYEEILVIVIFWCYMFGCAYGSREESHITADILGVLMKKSRVKNVLTLLRYILTLLLGVVMFVWTIQLAMWAFKMNTQTTVYRIPTMIGYISMPIGLGISTFYNVVYLVREIFYFKDGKDSTALKNEIVEEEV